MKFGVIIFPGTNCDMDAYHVAGEVMGQDVEYIWHQDTNLDGFDCIIVPGGFSYGDYLRTGAIARFSPVMQSVQKFAEDGGLVIGICNGFQILLEAGMLPGVMRRNKSMKFVCKFVNLRTETTNSPYTNACKKGQILRIPIAHGEGNYYADPETLKQLNEQDRIIFRYCSPEGELTEESNPNGSLENIAGICNEKRNVFGLMPHPERSSEAILGSDDGRLVFESILKHCGVKA